MFIGEAGKISSENARNIVLFGTPDCPTIVLPPKSTYESIKIATDLTSVPPVLDALPKTNRRPYVIFDIRNMSPNVFKAEPSVANTKTVEEKTEVTASGILVVSDLDFGEKGNRRRNRQFQRLTQFKKIIEIADRWERNLDGFLPSDQIEPTKKMILLFRHIAASLYEELSGESLTKQTAEGIVEEDLPKPDRILTKAEEIIRELSLNLTDVFSSINAILHPRPQKEIDSETKKLTSEAKDRERLEHDSKEPKNDEETTERMRELAEQIDKAYKKSAERESELYVHNPILDEPSKEAAAYVRELWERPF